MASDLKIEKTKTHPICGKVTTNTCLNESFQFSYIFDSNGLIILLNSNSNKYDGDCAGKIKQNFEINN